MWWFLKRKEHPETSVYTQDGEIQTLTRDRLTEVQKRYGEIYKEDVEVFYIFEGKNRRILRSFGAKIALAGLRLKDVLTESDTIRFKDVIEDDGKTQRYFSMKTDEILAIGCKKKTEKIRTAHRYRFETEMGIFEGDVVGTSVHSIHSKLREDFIALRNAEFKRRKYPVILLNRKYVISAKEYEDL